MRSEPGRTAAEITGDGDKREEEDDEEEEDEDEDEDEEDNDNEEDSDNRDDGRSVSTEISGRPSQGRLVCANELSS